MKVGHCQAPNTDPRSPRDRGFFFYRVAIASTHAHRFAVALRLDDPGERPVRLSLPAWIPGSYLIRDFARHLVSIRATCGGRSVALAKLDKQTWELGPTGGETEVAYEVYARDLSVRAAFLDGSRAYFNGTSLLLRVEGAEDQPCLIELVPPEDSFATSWRVATTLSPEAMDAKGFGIYRASSYWDAIDHPVEWSEHAVAQFDVEGVPHRVAVSGRLTPNTDLSRLVADLQEVCACHARLFGGLPVPEFLFLLHATADAYGGLEHCRSTSLIASRDDLPIAGDAEAGEGYRRLLGLCSHEYFHLWNVKRIRPACFVEPDLAAEVHTTLLWAFEGITSYYDDLMLVRSRRIGVQSYLELLARNIGRLQRTPGRCRQSLAEASFDAWTKLYKPDENSPNAGVSYYLKGGLVAWGLDVELRLATGDRVTLDELMRALWQRFGATGEGLREGDLERLATELAGVDMQGFFERYVHDTVELPVGEWCAAFGLGLRLRPARDDRDEGGVLGTAPTDAPQARGSLGVRTKAHEGGVTLVTVFDSGPAQCAGLSAGDVVVAVGGLRASAESFAKLVSRAPVGERLAVHAFRGDVLLEFEVEPKPAPSDTCDLWLLGEREASAAQLARRATWLDGH